MHFLNVTNELRENNIRLCPFAGITLFLENICPENEFLGKDLSRNYFSLFDYHGKKLYNWGKMFSLETNSSFGKGKSFSEIHNLLQRTFPPLKQCREMFF